jgi:hypothetical protein
MKVRKLNSIRFLVSKRADEVYDSAVYETYIKPGSGSQFYKLIARLIAGMDVRFFRAVKDLFIQIKYGRKKTISGY